MNRNLITDQNPACIIGFKDKWIMRIGIPLLGCLIPFIFFNQNNSIGFNRLLILIFVSILNTFIFWKMDKGIIIYFRSLYPNHVDYSKRLIFQFLVIIILTFFISTFLIWLQNFIPTNYDEFSPRDNQVHAATYAVTFFVIAIYEAMYFFDLWKMGLVENEKLKTENSKAQLNVLKNQINPHFLFNSFNTLTSIIPENPEIAVKFTSELSKFYRFILELKNKELIPLQKEIECIDSFIYLQKIRFEENLKIEINIDEHVSNQYIVPLALQILVENALKHNIVSKSKPLKITIYAKEGQICVENNIQLMRETESTYTGLQNIRKRYELLTKKEISIFEDGNIFRVCIPLILVQE